MCFCKPCFAHTSIPRPQQPSNATEHQHKHHHKENAACSCNLGQGKMKADKPIKRGKDVQTCISRCSLGHLFYIRTPRFTSSPLSVPIDPWEKPSHGQLHTHTTCIILCILLPHTPSTASIHRTGESGNKPDLDQGSTAMVAQAMHHAPRKINKKKTPQFPYPESIG